MNAIRIVFVFLCLSLLKGCVSIKPSGPSQTAGSQSEWQSRKTELLKISEWDIRGRLAVRTKDDGGSATLVWERSGSKHRIELFGPFGGGRIRIEQNPEGATLVDNKKNQFRGKTAQDVLYRRVGWHVPFDSLAYWLRGLPEPGKTENLMFDSSGLITSFDQKGWSIQFVGYSEQGSFLLPRKLYITALPGTVHLIDDDGKNLGGELEVRVVLKRWLVQG